jgi:nucleoid-associated protein YgaU
METQIQKGKKKKQFGLFLFFVVSLFMLQIAFAFTIHGDIGPQTDVVPYIDKPASPFLVGRIDSLISEKTAIMPKKVVPNGMFAPASKEINEPDFTVARIDSEDSSADAQVVVRKTSETRFYQYHIRSGDTLERISKKLYGSSKMTQSLIRLNRITNEKTLQLGSALLVPKSGLLDTIKVL